jgi:ribose transport system substrate-binding protein
MWPNQEIQRWRMAKNAIRTIFFAASVALLPAVLAGCAPIDAPKKVIGVSVLTLTHQFFIDLCDGLKTEAARQGYEVIIVTGESDVAKQDKQVKDFLVRRVDAIVLSPCNSKAIGPVIEEANRAGVPVFTVDIACLAPGAKVITHVATDNLEGGRLAAQAMIEVLGQSGGKVAIIDFRQAESCTLRVQGFKEVIGAHNAKPGASKIEIVTELPGGGAKEMAYKAAEDIVQAHPDVVGIFAINDQSALGARAALEKARRADRIKIIGFDGQPEGKQAIREGKIHADPLQFPDQLGRETAKVVARYFEGEPVPAQILVEPRLYYQADALKEFGTK